MLGKLLQKLLKRDVHVPIAPGTRLHIGGTQPHPDWKILNVQAGPHVDYLGSCTDLSMFAEGSIAEIYASHVLEHLGYHLELPRALAEMRRVLAPGGMLRISVPDLDVLATLLIDPASTLQERFHVMRIAFGGQMDPHDFHRTGLNFGFLVDFLRKAGFEDMHKVECFGLFDDTSNLRFRDRLVSLNIQTRKPGTSKGTPVRE